MCELHHCTVLRAPIDGRRAKPESDAVPALHGHLHGVDALHAVRIVPRAADAAIAIDAAAIVHVLVIDREQAVLRVDRVLRAAQRDTGQTDAMIDRRRAAEQTGVAGIGGPLWREREIMEKMGSEEIGKLLSQKLDWPTHQRRAESIGADDAAARH